ncbi:MAG: hypothetical protein ABSF44_10860 [Candidatus Bathyarchaeia archaeon]
MNWKDFAPIFAIGAVFLIGGLAINLIINSEIAGLQFQLQGNGLTDAQIASDQASLNGYQSQKISLYNPLSEMFIVIGFMIMAGSVIYAIFSLWNKSLDQEKQDLFENARVSEEPTKSYTTPEAKTLHKTGFPIAGGILTIITASFTIFTAFLAIAQAASYTNLYYFQQNLTYLVFALFVGIWNFIAFGLGLAGGIFSIKRNHFALSIVGISLLLVAGFFSFLEFGIFAGAWYSGMIIGMPLIILAILSVIFVGVSKNEFI